MTLEGYLMEAVDVSNQSPYVQYLNLKHHIEVWGDVNSLWHSF